MKKLRLFNLNGNVAVLDSDRKGHYFAKIYNEKSQLIGTTQTYENMIDCQQSVENLSIYPININ